MSAAAADRPPVFFYGGGPAYNREEVGSMKEEEGYRDSFLVRQRVVIAFRERRPSPIKYKNVQKTKNMNVQKYG